MGYNSGFLRDRVAVLNRREAQQGRFGLDSAGIEWERAAEVHANVGYQKGKSGMAAGALDVYAVKIVRMRWNAIVNERSRIEHQGRTYQIIAETFNADRQANEIQFLMQQVVNDTQPVR